MTSSTVVKRGPVNKVLFAVVLVAAAILIFEGGNNVVQADEFPTFFLKAAKSVPRIGRRSGVSPNTFYGISGSGIPQAGRRGFAPNSAEAAADAWPLYHKGDHFSGSAGLLSAEESYIRGMEESPEFWEMTAGNDGIIPSEVWRREKRSGKGQVEA